MAAGSGRAVVCERAVQHRLPRRAPIIVIVVIVFAAAFTVLVVVVTEGNICKDAAARRGGRGGAIALPAAKRRAAASAHAGHAHVDAKSSAAAAPRGCEELLLLLSLRDANAVGAGKAKRRAGSAFHELSGTCEHLQLLNLPRSDRLFRHFGIVKHICAARHSAILFVKLFLPLAHLLPKDL